MRLPAIMHGIAALLSAFPAAAQKGQSPVDTVVMLEGACDFRVDDKKIECDSKLLYTKFTNHRVAITALPSLLGGVDFSGGKDIQPAPGNYLLTVDKLILSGGTVVPADGFCHVDIRADGQLVYKVECKALAHDGRSFELDFAPEPKPPKIMHF